jgi:hypothetical protein
MYFSLFNKVSAYAVAVGKHNGVALFQGWQTSTLETLHAEGFILGLPEPYSAGDICQPIETSSRREYVIDAVSNRLTYS